MKARLAAGILGDSEEGVGCDAVVELQLLGFSGRGDDETRTAGFPSGPEVEASFAICLVA